MNRYKTLLLQDGATVAQSGAKGGVRRCNFLGDFHKYLKSLHPSGAKSGAGKRRKKWRKVEHLVFFRTGSIQYN